MNVIGIIQTDLNEFSVLFEQQNGGQGGQSSGGQNGGGQQSSGGGQDFQDSDSMFLSFLDEQPTSGEGSGQSSQGGQGQGQQSGPQELTVRIKGIPEGQKANFLQMYQILQDAQDSQSLEQSLTIINNDQQDGQDSGRRQSQGQGHGSGKQNKTTH
ncbi:hypothetical protein BAG01nite_04060 [Brevibacillus agri]|uniref:Uncharacterized protein n=1 Tax=Brevibacillus agri TaxID=51101 RepID=A0A3M8AZ45_9BACL|nr:MULTISPECIES: hypothetical protein [Brevibacillus]MBG9564956.1 hypothetical protein [Brevibacillus agri]MED1822740.1 hypothetical protein [Brevibacillus agri]QAV13484.1 hypothetical protein BA6348_12410 [Brevibacillus agri]QHZ56095.1 hypothetical protein M655_010785 [Brevibacillus sp. NSP2.1]RNB56476.1 hypothetical protein EB820_09525 [Brevibacillus agri]